MFYNILDKKRIAILPLLTFFKKDYYLAGGTALALQIGHRDSIDFDFFSKKDIDTQKLFEQILEIFKGKKVIKIQDEKNTLTVIIDTNIKISFFTYKYKLTEKLISEEHFRLASITDIGCMKLSAITSRASNKDYIDLYYILQKINLTHLLAKTEKKYTSLDQSLILKSLVYFDDINKEPIKFKNKHKTNNKEMKNFFYKEIKKLRIT